MTDRNMDGFYFRVGRGNGYDSVAFSDLTEGQMTGVLSGKDKKFLVSLCVGLGQRLRHIGDIMELNFSDE